MTAHETAWIFLKEGCVGKARGCGCPDGQCKMQNETTNKSLQMHYPSDDDELCDIASMGMCDCTPETGCKMKKMKRFRKSINSSFAKSKKDPRLARAGVSGYNKPKRTLGSWQEIPCRSGTVRWQSENHPIRSARQVRCGCKSEDTKGKGTTKIIQSTTPQEHRTRSDVSSVLGRQSEVVMT